MSKKTNGFEKPNHTQTPNSFFDEFMKIIDTMAELKVTLAIIRQTVGWHRKRARYGVGKLVKLTGLARNSVLAGAEAAEARGTIVRIPTDGEAIWELVIEENASEDGDANFDGGAETEGDPRQSLTKTPSAVEGLKRKKENKESTFFEFEKLKSGHEGEGWKGREIFLPEHLPLVDWYHKTTGQDCPKSKQKDWMRAVTDWTANGLTPDHLQAAYEMDIKWKGVITSPNELTLKAIALKAQVAVRQSEKAPDPYASLHAYLENQ